MVGLQLLAFWVEALLLAEYLAVDSFAFDVDLHLADADAVD